jgi:hypothetical protein
VIADGRESEPIKQSVIPFLYRNGLKAHIFHYYAAKAMRNEYDGRCLFDLAWTLSIKSFKEHCSLVVNVCGSFAEGDARIVAI